MNRALIATSMGALVLGLAGMAPDDPPAETAEQKFEKLLEAALKAPEKADWKPLRRAFAETKHYQPYSVEVTEKLRKIAPAIGRGEFEASEAELTKLLERERYMRVDTLAMMMMLCEKSGQAEKAAKYRKMLDGVFKILFDPKAGVSFERPIEVLFIEEEYLVTNRLPAKRKGLISHDGHRFDVFQIDAQGDEPAREMFFNVDLPQKTLSRLFEKAKD